MHTGNHDIDGSDAEWVIGSDEAGYGTWAGDLVVGGVAVLRSWSDPKVSDSKKLSAEAREEAVRRHRGEVLWKVVTVPPSSIDEIGVWRAAIQAHNHVHEFLREKLLERHPEATILHVVDGLENARGLLLKGLHPLPKADLKVPAVSLASCFAKVGQCKLMDLADRKYPGYGFASHRGYGVPQHQAALKKLGICDIHRKSYSSIKPYLKKDPTLWDLMGSEDSAEV